MAAGCELRCERCGKTVSVVCGMYYNGGWNNPEIRRDIMAGRYGRKATEALIAHPNALYYIEANLYRCEGHFIGSRDDLIIFSNDLSKPELYFKTKKRCPVCRKVMGQVEEGPGIPCPKCNCAMDWRETWIERGPRIHPSEFGER